MPRAEGTTLPASTMLSTSMSVTLVARIVWRAAAGPLLFLGPWRRSSAMEFRTLRASDASRLRS
eukprot:2265387-Pyramimonas_sp.AAC.1